MINFKRLLSAIPKGSVILTITTALSYFLGLLRDRFFAQTFGASRELDAYQAAFLFPDLLFNILIASGIAAAFVPILTELLKLNKEKAQAYINSILTTATGTMLIMSILVSMFAKSISAIVAPGFEPAERLLVAQIIRVLALSPIFFTASNVLGAILITRRRFLFYGLSPILYNLGIIFGTFFLTPKLGIMGVAWGTLLGAIFHLIARIIDVWWHGFKFKLAYSFKTPEFRQTIRLMLPKMFGHPLELVTFWGFTAIASSLAPGSVVILNFARNFQSVPVSLIGITLATTSFPILSQAVSEKTKDIFWKTFKNSFFLILFFSSFSALSVFILRESLIRILLGGGAFGENEIKQTAAALGFFCLSIPTEALSHLLARAFYATKNTTIPVAFSILGILIAIPGGYWLSSSLGLIALPIAFFLSSALKLIALLIWLPIRLKKI